MKKRFGKAPDYFKFEPLPQTHGALVGAHHEVKLHGAKPALPCAFQRMRAHGARNPAPRCRSSRHVSAVCNVPAAALLVCSQEVCADNLPVFFRHEVFMFGGSPVGEGSFLIRVARQRIGFTIAEDRLHDRPDRVVIPRGCASNQHASILPRLPLGPGSSTPYASRILKLQVSSMFLVLLLQPAATTVARNSVVLRCVLGTPRENHRAVGEVVL